VKFFQPIGFRHLIIVEEGYPFPGSRRHSRVSGRSYTPAFSPETLDGHLTVFGYLLEGNLRAVR